MGTRASQSTSNTQTTQLPGSQQTNVDTLMQGALDLYNTGGPQYFSGNTFAGATPLQTQGREGAVNYAGGVGGALAGDVVNNDRFWLNPNNIFNPSAIPGFAAATKNVTDGVTRNLTESILPNIRSGSVATGNLGGSRQGIAEGLAVGRTNEALAGALGNMNMQGYQMGLQQNNAAASRAPQTYGVGMAPSNTQQSVGAALRDDEQGAINANMDRWNFEQMRPFLNLQSLQGFTGTAGQYGGTTSSTGKQGVSDGGGAGMQLAGTALMAAAMF